MNHLNPTPAPSLFFHVARWVAFAAALGALGLGSVHAASYYLQEGQTGTNSRTLDELQWWFSEQTGDGANPTTLDGHDFFSNGFQIRTGTTNFTFGNANTTLTLNSGSANRLALRAGPANVITIHNLISQGGGARIFAGSTNVNLVANNVTLTGGATRFDADGGSNTRTINFSVGTLAGDGDMELHGNGLTFNLSIANGLAYTGDIIWTNTTAALSFGNSLTTGGGLIASSTSLINLTQDVTFASVSLSGVELAAGTYSYDYLAGHETFGSLFLADGSGSITVAPIPEPASWALLVSGAALLVAGCRRGRRAS